MKNAQAIRSTIIFTVVILIAVFLLLNALAHSHTHAYQGKGRKGLQQKFSVSQELLRKDNLLEKQLDKNEIGG